jgi:hypothetical protein
VEALWPLRRPLLEELCQPEVERRRQVLRRSLLVPAAPLSKELLQKTWVSLPVPLMTSRPHSQPFDSPVTGWPCSSAGT